MYFCHAKANKDNHKLASRDLEFVAMETEDSVVEQENDAIENKPTNTEQPKKKKKRKAKSIGRKPKRTKKNNEPTEEEEKEVAFTNFTWNEKWSEDADPIHTFEGRFVTRRPEKYEHEFSAEKRTWMRNFTLSPAVEKSQGNLWRARFKIHEENNLVWFGVLDPTNLPKAPHKEYLSGGWSFGSYTEAETIYVKDTRNKSKKHGKVIFGKGDVVMIQLNFQKKMEQVKDPDSIDSDTPEAWIPRHPDLIRNTGRLPLNAEPPTTRLLEVNSSITNFAIPVQFGLHWLHNYYKQ